MLLRYLALLVLVLLVWMFLSRLLGEVRRSLGGGERGRVGGQDGPRVSRQEELLPCDACGVRVPESRLLTDGRHRYCSPECRRLGDRPPS